MIEGFYHIASLILYALYAVVLYNIYRILASPQSGSARIAWILIHLVMPFVAVPLYYLFGQNRIPRYLRRAQRRSREFFFQEAHRVLLPEDILGTQSAILTESEHFSRFGKAFSNLGAVSDPHFNQVDLLIDGQSTFDAIFAAIAQAQSYIFVQYYILKSDRLGIELKNLLISRAKTGVSVYLLYDDMGSFWLSQEYLYDLQQAGVKLARFLPLTAIKRGFQMNFRNHRKLVVVDGRYAFTGGLNVGEEYVGRSQQHQRWRDTHLKISGPGVAQLEEIFLEDWYFANRQALAVPEFRRPRESFPQDPKALPLVQIVPTGPTDQTQVGLLLFMSFLQAAKERIWIATPYFIPDITLIREFELCAMRGVDVRILLPRYGDNPPVHWVSLYYSERLEKKGIKVYLYEPGFMHQKVVLIDKITSILGTTNFDNRAIFLNFETTLVIHSKELGQQVEAMLRQDFGNSHRIPYESNFFLRHLKRARAHAARL